MRPVPSEYALERFLEQSQVRLIRPLHYMDKWRLDRQGVHVLDNTAVKQALGFRR